MKTVLEKVKDEKKKFKKLSPEFVDALGELKDERKELQEKERILVEKAKKLMAKPTAPITKKQVTRTEEGKKVQKVYSPRQAEFEFVYSTFPCLDVSWREEYEALWKKVNGKNGWKKHLKKLPRREQAQLDVNRK